MKLGSSISLLGVNAIGPFLEIAEIYQQIAESNLKLAQLFRARGMANPDFNSQPIKVVDENPSPQQPESDYMTPEEAAAYLRCHKNTLFNREKEDRLVCKYNGRKKLYKRQDILALLESSNFDI